MGHRVISWELRKRSGWRFDRYRGMCYALCTVGKVKKDMSNMSLLTIGVVLLVLVELLVIIEELTPVGRGAR